MKAREVQARLRSLANPEHVKTLSWFFKTGPGQYGEGDKFIGLKVPVLRKLAKEYKTLPLGEIERLLHSEIHEERLFALMLLVMQSSKADVVGKKAIHKFYLANTRSINNWDLVDLSAPQIVGAFLADKDRKILYKLARSKSLWQRRIAIVATFAFIRADDFGDTLALAEILLGDREDLLHKATGWMLREVGKRDLPALEGFLDKHTLAMPRTMLRYAIEKLPEKKRLAYLKRK
jgi:3-methyladenine DNA glycosylase AlkD